MFTVLGHTGFIGRRLAALLEAQDEVVYTPAHGDRGVFEHHLGHVIDCVGCDRSVTEAHAVVDSHVTHLSNVLAHAKFDSFLYLSSTRVYLNARHANEDAELTVLPDDPDRLFNLTKLTGEALCLSMDKPDVRIARLSNVYGYNPRSTRFLASLIRAAVTGGCLKLSLSPESAKDYVSTDDVTDMLPRIALSGRHRIYNLAAGRNTSARVLVGKIQELTKCRSEWQEGAPTIRYPEISIDRLVGEFGYSPRDVIEDLASVIAAYRQALDVTAYAEPVMSP